MFGTAKKEPAAIAEPVLTPGERQSAVWLKVKKHLEERLAVARARNDTSLSHDKTEKLRGRIAELKYLAGLGDPAPQTEADDDFPDS